MQGKGNLWSKVQGAINTVEDVFVAGACIALFAIVAMITTEIIARKIFDASIYIAGEYSGYALPIIMALALARITRQKTHLSVEFFVRMLSEKARQVLDFIFSVILFMIYNFVMTYIVYRLFSQSLIDGTHSQEVSHTALWIPQIVIVFGMLVTDLRIIIDLVSSVAQFKVDTAKRLGNVDLGV